MQTAEQIKETITAAAPLAVVWGVDASAFMADVEYAAATAEQPICGAFETDSGDYDAIGRPCKRYELYVFHATDFAAERKAVTDATAAAPIYLRRWVRNLRPYANGGASTFTSFEGGAFGGVYTTLTIRYPRTCD